MKGSKKVTFKAAAVSDVGGRKNNEDAFIVNEDAGLFIVADGMGGHDKGEVASWFTSENLERIIKEATPLADNNLTLDPILPGESRAPDYDHLMEYAVLVINRKLFELNEKLLEKDYPTLNAGDAALMETLKKRRRMGTTLVSLLLRGGRAYITHVGDSRAYRIANNEISQLTHDHSWVEERVRDGTLTPEQAKTHEKRNVITRSVGFNPELQADIDALTLYPPERFLLCSDGLSGVVDEDELLKLGQMHDLRTACAQMVEAAIDRGATDNVTVVLVDISKPRDEGEKHPSQGDWTDTP